MPGNRRASFPMLTRRCTGHRPPDYVILKIGSSSKKEIVMIIKCSCEHKYQDKVYGKGRRVMNPTSSMGQYRCTVCGAEKIHGTTNRWEK